MSEVNEIPFIDKMREDPKVILTCDNVTEDMVDIVFDIHGTEWIKKTTISGKWKELIRMESVRRDPDLIRYFVKPSIQVLAEAIKRDPELLWVARCEKKEDAVIKYIEEEDARIKKAPKISLGQKIKNFFRIFFK